MIATWAGTLSRSTLSYIEHRQGLNLPLKMVFDEPTRHTSRLADKPLVGLRKLSQVRVSQLGKVSSETVTQRVCTGGAAAFAQDASRGETESREIVAPATAGATVESRGQADRVGRLEKKRTD